MTDRAPEATPRLVVRRCATGGDPDPAADARAGIAALRERTDDPVERCFYESVLDTFDFPRHATLQAAHLAAGSTRGILKYLDLPYQLWTKYSYVTGFGLDRPPSRRLLDIGSGAGHFAFICRYFGHHVHCLDVASADVFNDLVALFGLPRTAIPVQAATPLPPTPPSDLVTAFHATFFRKGGKALFTLAEWRFFFQDLIRHHVALHGRIHLWLSRLRDVDGFPTEDEAFVAMVDAGGGRVHKRHVVFDDVGRCPDDWLTADTALALGDAAAIADAARVLLTAGEAGEAAAIAAAAWPRWVGARDAGALRLALRALLAAGAGDLLDPRLSQILARARAGDGRPA